MICGIGLTNEMFTADSVTGNGSGSYTFNAYEAGSAMWHITLICLAKHLMSFVLMGATLA